MKRKYGYGYPRLVCILEEQPVRFAKGPKEGWCSYHRPLDMDYLSWHAEAERRHKAGQRQQRCPDCNKVLYADEWGKKS